ncbi:hypothetical protein ACNKXV_04375 [Christiangramia aquimixticola]
MEKEKKGDGKSNIEIASPENQLAMTGKTWTQHGEEKRSSLKQEISPCGRNDCEGRWEKQQ